MLLERRLVAIGRKCHTSVIGPVRVGRQIAGTVGCTDLEPWKAIQRAVEDPMRESNGRIEWISDHVGQHAVPLQTFLEFWSPRRVHEQQRPEFVRLGPKRIEPACGQLLAVDARADGPPRIPSFLIPSSNCCAARSGCCKATLAKATN